MTKNILVAAILGGMAFGAQAADWTGAGELGLAYARGNSNSDTFNAKAAVKKEDDSWVYEAAAEILRVKGEVTIVDAAGATTHVDKSTANRYGLGGKASYKFSPMNYAYGSLRYDNDDFAPYEWQAVVAAGYGHTFVKNDRTEFSMEAGPGYRRIQPVDHVQVVPGPPQQILLIEPDSDGDFIARGAANFKHKLTDTTEIGNVLLVETGGGRTFVQNDLGAAVKINAHFSLKAGFQVRYNNNTPAGVDSTDRLLTTNVVYGF